MAIADIVGQSSVSNVERVTRRFYELFRQERLAFLEGIQGLAVQAERERYAALMLNRLMVCYFLQQKGLFDQDRRYLSNHLRLSRHHGQETFYRTFLLPLFFTMLSSAERSDEQRNFFGDIPYLGSELFSQHPIEQTHPVLHITDESLEHLFIFFDGYCWSLDKQLAGENEGAQVIDPGILSYVFEQHINQQQMGAYYTRSDVTQYIAQNTILPYLFERIASRVPNNQHYDAIPWRLLREQPDRYIQPAMRQEAALPGEDAQEYNRRRACYAQLRRTLAVGEVTNIDDALTYNLDLARFAQDALQQEAEPSTLITWFEELAQISILDPTCGSGAFLFAALAVLGDLYEACLDRVEELGMDVRTLYGEQWYPVTAHQRRYASIKMILQRNLYGVDIMEEAVDICRLQCFLLLLAQVEPGSAIEPFTGVALNIRVGNALSGFVTSDELGSAAPGPLARGELDALLARVSGGGGDAHEPLEQWRARQRPFHWLYEFPEVMQREGFSVVLGNPPYVEYTGAPFAYTLHNYSTLSCANLYTCVVERSRQLLSAQGRLGMLLPLAAFATKNMIPLMDGLEHWFPCSWLSFYHFRPSMLFSGGKIASIPTAIYLAKVHGPLRRYSTHIHKWSAQQRDLLFSTLTYCRVTLARDPANRHYYPKFGSPLENGLMEKVRQQECVSRYLARRTNENSMYYRSAGGLYWKVFLNFAWPYATTSNKQCSFQEGFDRDVFVAVFNSSLFWWYYTVTFDTFNLKDYMLFGFRFSYPGDEQVRTGLQQCCQYLMEDYRRNAKHLKRGETGSYTIYARKSKAIIDQIDQILARHYNLSGEELNFIINYDIKYRTGILPG